MRLIYEYEFEYDEYDEEFDDDYEINFFKLVFVPTLEICAILLFLSLIPYTDVF